MYLKDYTKLNEVLAGYYLFKHEQQGMDLTLYVHHVNILDYIQLYYHCTVQTH